MTGPQQQRNKCLNRQASSKNSWFSKKNISRLADSVPLLFYWHFKVCTEWAQISKAKTSPEKVRKYFVLNLIMFSWQHSLAAVMCYILSNTSQKGRQIETNCPWGWTFHYFVMSVCPSLSVIRVLDQYSRVGRQIKIAGEYFNGAKIRDTCDQMPGTVLRVIYMIWSFVDWTSIKKFIVLL